mmetsp:Transcript_325/g.802  ORF Transcript_325/g.802 Transcript_325/m.802 type:complete len:244 (+) Transcript_325:652-1383(+)
MLQNGHSLLVVSLQSLDQGSRSIVLTLHQGFARFVIRHGFGNGLSLIIQFHGLGRGVLDMEGSTRSLVNPATANTFLQNGIRNVQFNDLGHGSTFLGQHFIQSLGLFQGTREAIQNKAKFAIILLDTILDDSDHDIITHQSTRLHDGFGFFAHGRLRGDGGAQHVPGTQLGQSQQIDNFGRVCALTGPGRSKQNHDIARPVGTKFVFHFGHGRFHGFATPKVERLGLVQTHHGSELLLTLRSN